jgi:O-antigen ligase
MRAYTAAAVFCAVIGTLAYLGLIPGADLFVRYGRAKATFKDPNVYGPFLVLPAMFALQRVLLGTLRQQIWASAIYLILFVGVFVSFSRAAWGHFAVSSLIVLALVFWLEANARDKVRIMIMSLTGAAMLIVALAGLLSIPSVASLFETRIESQDYDTGETGRFGRQGYAFDLALETPWGIGPQEFSFLRIVEAPHNVYVTVLHAYGWGGGAMYYLLVILTLWLGLRGLLRPSPYRLMLIPLMATFVMLVAESAIIDSDHWRHYFLVAGLICGISSAIGNDPRTSAPRQRMLI